MRSHSASIEVAATVTRASGVPADWQPWSGEVAVPAGTTLLMNATHLGCAPELEEVPLAWDTLDPACVVSQAVLLTCTTFLPPRCRRRKVKGVSSI